MLGAAARLPGADALPCVGEGTSVVQAMGSRAPPIGARPSADVPLRLMARERETLFGAPPTGHTAPSLVQDAPVIQPYRCGCAGGFDVPKRLLADSHGSIFGKPRGAPDPGLL
jgi:hypothetical protein